MDNSQDREIDELVKLVIALKEAPELKNLIISLLQQPESKRQELLLNLSTRIKSDGAPSDLVSSINLLRNPSLARKVYDQLAD